MSELEKLYQPSISDLEMEERAGSDTRVIYLAHALQAHQKDVDKALESFAEEIKKNNIGIPQVGVVVKVVDIDQALANRGGNNV